MTCETCYCGRCAPSAAPVQCSVCGQEVRIGERDGIRAWWHREAVDHIAILGHRLTFAALEKIEAMRREPRERQVPTREGFPLLFTIEPYTTGEFDIGKDPNAERRKRRLALWHGEDPDAPPPPLPEPEIPSTPLEIDDLPPRSGMRQIANLVVKTPGWELVRLTTSRGPYLGADGSVLSISDSVVLRARGPLLDFGRPLAVASWRDGGFDFALAGTLRDGVCTIEKVGSPDLKAWIKEHPWPDTA